MAECGSRRRLFLFSDHSGSAGEALDAWALREAGVPQPRVAWIASGGLTDKTRGFFAERCAHYARHGVADVTLLVLQGGRTCTPDLLLGYDVVHLAGGNCYVFLRRLHASGVFEALQQYIARGGVVVGDSAGAILLTPSIAIAGFFPPRRGKRSGDLTALAAVPFEFHPHWGSGGAALPALREYATATGHTLYAAPDGSGLAVLDGAVHAVGKVVQIAADGSCRAAPTASC
ncbi:Type 1 glutamine amidotransferase-like domain-containing protein [Chitiniphilus purpureus]|uniref:Type 1 glutamine amidotransferase-like domain-containing protein n=1 Tax=Chitiniphilus purpureus TaxID=2981137 RepID=A0ABY6DPZ2_9NEIS|nr:Type 1 glutamine amidotransferase-like domain-containing protein [Chitiniphilus sp. CD1]UXY16293.1 Type 1 glutamine amidotransferase-like domain-containing protein [Chitiniphilus sp. CD1]